MSNAKAPGLLKLAAMKAWVKTALEDWEDGGVIFRQLMDTSGSSTYTYLLADKRTKEVDNLVLSTLVLSTLVGKLYSASTLVLF